ncbi:MULTISPECIES: HlyD family secretion protein [Pseudanabaena]|uniref:Secretion protein HlyD family protein n=2 Tax=Pseudanabaena TaxID=1152 RepID=L8N304_9CYAN|nr:MULTISPECIES: efflux RND transporter periplasmic adaptor subunit [Pseudanabaena]ELS32633.1 secretion protein HlyD family protein [Pseudanabaena biceps PCC 7429]MDG3495125.1 efflux RND transporter periplasmic adaptor subunit [Pseudanabaena catenata USMAC16]
MTQTAPNPPESTQQQSNLPSSLPTPTLDVKKKKINLRLIIPLTLAIGVIGYGIWMILPKPAETVLHVSGRLESDETDIGAKTGGRIVTILVREGDTVKKDQLVVEIEDEEIPAQLSGLNAQIEAARQEELQAKDEVSVAESRIREASLNLQQSEGDSVGRIDQAQFTVAATESDLRQSEAQVKQSEAQLQQSKAELRLAAIDRDRYADLVKQGAVNQQQFDQKQTALETSLANLNTAEAKLVASRAGVTAARDRFLAAQGSSVQVRSTGLNPDIRTAQLDAYYLQRTQAIAKLAAAQAKVKNAQASRDQIQRRLDSFKVKSPINGIVQSRPLESGAVVATGKTLLTIIDPNAVYLRCYIPEGDIGKIRVGQVARVFLDSSPNKPFAAHVAQIDTKASFTPENIYFKQDRVKQVFGVKLAIDQPEGFAKSGMPADAEIDLK